MGNFMRSGNFRGDYGNFREIFASSLIMGIFEKKIAKTTLKVKAQA